MCCARSCKRCTSGARCEHGRPRDPIGDRVRGAPVSIDEKVTLRSVAAVLSEDDIGAALVERADGLLGIVSERDVTRALADDTDRDICDPRTS
jgi:CBS domain-containing protein